MRRLFVAYHFEYHYKCCVQAMLMLMTLLVFNSLLRDFDFYNSHLTICISMPGYVAVKTCDARTVLLLYGVCSHYTRCTRGASVRFHSKSSFLQEVWKNKCSFQETS